MKGKLLTVFIILALILGVEILLLLKLAYSLKSFADYWNNQNSSQHEANYLALGDSTAQGIGAAKPYQSYVGLLARDLNLQAVNFSVSGAKTKDVTKNQLPQLKKYDIQPPTIVTLAIGANDMKSFEAVRFEADMDELLSQLPKQTVVADIPYFGGGRFRTLESRILAANQIIYRLVAKHNLTLVQLHQITKERDSLLVYAPDFFHPSAIGYKNWRDAFTQVLAQ